MIRISLKVLSAAAALAMLLPLAAPTESFAHNARGNNIRHGGAVHASRSARAVHHGAPLVRLSDDMGCHDRGVFISGSVVGGLGFCDNGYYER